MSVQTIHEAALGEICTMYQPVTITKNEMRDDGDFLVYGANGVIGRYDKFNHEDPQLIIGCRGACGTVHVTEPKSWITGNSMVIKPVNSMVDISYLRYFFMQPEVLASVITGAAQPQITRKSLLPVKVPVPPLDEQKRIVAKLDQAFAALNRARTNAEANLADAGNLFEQALHATFTEAAVGTRALPFAALCEALTPKARIKRQDYLEEGLYPIVSQEARLVSGYWNDSEALMGLSEPVIVFGDHTRCLKYVDFDFVVGADGTKVLKPKPGILAAYLYFGLRSQPIPEGGYARHFKLLREKCLPELPMDRQVEIAGKLFDMEARSQVLAQRYEDQLTDIAALRQSLLQQAFSGQLT